MNPVLQRKEVKKGFLWGALAALNAPLVFFPAIQNIEIPLLDRIFRRNADFQDQDPNPARLLPKDHALTKIANELSVREGMKVAGVFLKDDENGFMNACVISEDKNNILIAFHGDPLVEANGEMIARGVIGHELGHAATRGNDFFRKTAMTTSSTYGLLAHGAALMGIFNDKIKALDATLAENLTMGTSSSVLTNLTGFMDVFSNRPLMLGTACVLYAASAATPYLMRAFAHNTEYIADLQSVEIAGPEPIMETLEFLDEKSRRAAAYNVAVDKLELRGKLSKYWDKIVGTLSAPFTHNDIYNDTHPSGPDRIETIRRASNGPFSPN